MPRVSVIIATYNWSEVLRYSVGSVLLQSFRDFELLVVGDGCTDDSQTVVESFGDPRVRWINLPENTRHQSGPNNEGLRQAKGRIVAYLGHDDLWLPHHLAAHVETLDSTDSDLAYSMCMLVPPAGAAGWPTIPRPQRGSFSPPAGVTHLLSVTSSLGGWRDYRTLDEIREESPDVELWRRMQKAGRKLAFVPRLTAIKFPAALRRDSYRTRLSGEQEHWFQRLRNEPDLESRLLVGFIASGTSLSGMQYRDLLHHLAGQTATRLGRRFGMERFGFRSPRGKSIDRIRRFKGLE